MDTTRKLALCRFRPRLCMRKNSCRRRRRRFFPNLDPPVPPGPAAGLLRESRWCGELTRYRRAAFGGTWTVSRLRPLRRRRFSTFCPPGVAMRARKPCVRFRRKLLGWYVRFIRYSFLSRSSHMSRATRREQQKRQWPTHRRPTAIVTIHSEGSQICNLELEIAAINRRARRCDRLQSAVGSQV